ncbi:hypothetical protein AAHK20_17885 [Trinickia sp. YCB016]
MTSVRLSTIDAARTARAPATVQAKGLDAAANTRAANSARGPSLTGYQRSDAIAAHLRLNSQVTGAQQTLAFLDRATLQLTRLKHAVVSQINGRARDGGENLAEQIAQFDACWKTRGAATGGRLSDQLGYGEAGTARQAFRIRGLDARSARAGKPETLVFHSAASKAPAIVRFDAEMPPDAQAARLNYSLARTGITASADDDGRITFSTPEANWPALEDSLMITGGGIRFPSGRPNRIQPEAVPGPIATHSWRTDSDAGLRDALRQVAGTLKQVTRLKTALQGKLDRAQQNIASAAGEAEQRWAAGYSAQFKDKLSSAEDFESFALAAQAAAHIDASRVRSLLNLPLAKPSETANGPGPAAAQPAAINVRRSGS